MTPQIEAALKRARELARAGQVEEARALLRKIDHPVAAKWLSQIDAVSAAPRPADKPIFASDERRAASAGPSTSTQSLRIADYADELLALHRKTDSSQREQLFIALGAAILLPSGLYVSSTATPDDLVERYGGILVAIFAALYLVLFGLYVVSTLSQHTADDGQSVRISRNILGILPIYSRTYHAIEKLSFSVSKLPPIAPSLAIIRYQQDKGGQFSTLQARNFLHDAIVASFVGLAADGTINLYLLRYKLALLGMPAEKGVELVAQPTAKDTTHAVFEALLLRALYRAISDQHSKMGASPEDVIFHLFRGPSRAPEVNVRNVIVQDLKDRGLERSRNKDIGNAAQTADQAWMMLVGTLPSEAQKRLRQYAKHGLLRRMKTNRGLPVGNTMYGFDDGNAKKRR